MQRFRTGKASPDGSLESRIQGSLQGEPVNLGGSPFKAPTSQAAREQAEGEGGELEKTRERWREGEEEGREEALL